MAEFSICDLQMRAPFDLLRKTNDVRVARSNDDNYVSFVGFWNSYSRGWPI